MQGDHLKNFIYFNHRLKIVSSFNENIVLQLLKQGNVFKDDPEAY